MFHSKNNVSGSVHSLYRHRTLLITDKNRSCCTRPQCLADIISRRQTVDVTITKRKIS